MNTNKCLVFIHVFAILLSIPSIAQSNACIDVYTQKAEIINTNARVSAQDYSQPNSRSLIQYRQFLGSTFQNFFSSMKPGSVWIDSGGGYGIAGMQAVMSKGVKVFVINAQDLWQHAESKRPSLDFIKSLTSDLSVSTEGIPVERNIMTTSSYLAWRKVLSQHFTVLAERIVEKVRTLKQSGFHYLVGFSETQLPKIQEPAALITDLYGAFFYSADRSRLLDLYYSQLSETGVAMIRTGFKDIDRGHGRRTAGGGLRDIVILPDGKKVDLIDFLVDRFPNVFSRDPRDSKVLIVRKNTDIKSLNLSELIRPFSHFMYEKGGVEYPVVQWTIDAS